MDINVIVSADYDRLSTKLPAKVNDCHATWDLSIPAFAIRLSAIASFCKIFNDITIFVLHENFHLIRALHISSMKSRHTGHLPDSENT